MTRKHSIRSGKPSSAEKTVKDIRRATRKNYGADFLIQNCAPIDSIILYGCFTEDYWNPDTALRLNEIAYNYSILIIMGRIPTDHTNEQEVQRHLSTQIIDKIFYTVSR